MTHPTVHKSLKFKWLAVSLAALLDGPGEGLLELHLQVPLELQFEARLSTQVKVDGLGVKVLPRVVVVNRPRLKLGGDIRDNPTRGTLGHGRGALAGAESQGAILIGGWREEGVSQTAAHLLYLLLQSPGLGQ